MSAKKWAPAGINASSGIELSRHVIAEDDSVREAFMKLVNKRIRQPNPDEIGPPPMATPSCVVISGKQGNYTRGVGSRGGKKRRKFQSSEKYVHLTATVNGVSHKYSAHHVILVDKHMKLNDPVLFPTVWKKNMHVSHECHYKRCGNPDHLKLITSEANSGKTLNCFNRFQCTQCGNGFDFCRCPERFPDVCTTKCIPVITGLCNHCKIKKK